MYKGMVVGTIILLLVTATANVMGERLTETYFSRHGNFTDCKWSQGGFEYSGKQSVTFAGEKCRFWTDYNAPQHPDEAFPDGSRASARNYCRNPSYRQVGPWCYPVGGKEAEDCAVRLCSDDKCRRTGSGVEYAGEKSHSTSGARCLKWSAILKYKALNTNLRKFPDVAFPDASRKWARRYCRNPDGSPGGPWCYVQDETSGKVGREFCDVELCGFPGKFVTAGSFSRHDAFIKINDGETSLSLSVRLWDPSAWKEADVRITLTSVAVPTTGDELRGADLGLEVVLKPFHVLLSGQSHVIKTVPFSAIQPSNLTLRWYGGYIKLDRDGSRLLRVPFKPKEPLSYFAVSGKNVIWDVRGLERTVVTSGSETAFQMRPLVPSPTGYHMQVWLRSRGGACVDLQETPVSRFPHVWVCFDDVNSTTVYYQREEKEAVTLLGGEKSFGAVSWWEWRKFSVSIDLDGLLTASRVIAGVATGGNTAVDLLRRPGSVMRRLRWFGFSTKRGAVALWSLSERAEQDNDTGRAVWPECLSSEGGKVSYSGSQWTSASGKPCRVWRLSRNSSKYASASASTKLNLCRVLEQATQASEQSVPVGAHCLVGDDVLEPCDVRPCRSGDCRYAGVATDYAGTLSSTRSKRTCRPWSQAAPSKLRGDSLYTERSISAARNFCRNPSRSATGPWCYTTDEDTPVDLCMVPDCDVAEDSIVLTQGMRDGRALFILPLWRAEDGAGFRIAVKQWDPVFSDGFTLQLQPANKSSSERLTIGDEGNMKITFERVDESGRRLFFQQSDSPYPILIGKWTKFWLRIINHQLQLGVGVSSIPIATFPSLGDAVFLDYYSSHGHAVGASLTRTECHIEQTSSLRWGRMMPLTYRGAKLPLRLWLRGSGVATVAVVKLPNEEATMAFSIGIDSRVIALLQDATPESITLAGFRSPFPLILPDQWTEFSFRLEEQLVQVRRMDQVIFEWVPTKPFLVYFFAVAVSGGTISWTANCVPPQLDSTPRHGGWSSWSTWSCSVTCGGGRGRRYRTCTAPPPNLIGRFCDGVGFEDRSCNDFPCGKISPGTFTELRTSLQLRTAALSVQVGGKTEFSCGESIAALLRREAPSVARSIAWTKNAFPLPRNLTRLLITESLSVRLSPTILTDAGVYVCQVHQGEDRLALRVVVLTVITPQSVETVRLRSGVSHQLLCPTLELALLFSGLRVRWFHSHGKLFIDRPLSSRQDEKLLVPGEKTSEGVWECVVYSVDLNSSWRTSWYRIQILPRATFFTHLLEDGATKWLFRWTGSELRAEIFLFTLFGGLILCVCFAVGTYAVYCAAVRGRGRSSEQKQSK